MYLFLCWLAIPVPPLHFLLGSNFTDTHLTNCRHTPFLDTFTLTHPECLFAAVLMVMCTKQFF